MWYLFLFLFQTVYCQGFYKISAPRVVRPNSEFHAAVTTTSTSETTTVTVALLGRSSSGGAYTVEETVSVQPYSTRIARLQIGDIDEGDYRLSVRGRGGIDFESSTSLHYEKKSYSVFVQTDKSVYKPKDKLLFRAIVLNSQLKPAAEVRKETLHVFITDGQGNRVKEWKGVTVTTGVFPGELKLSDNPVLGDWNVSVTIHGHTFNKTVQVANYILPKFLVNIQAPEHLTFKENILTAHIQSLYNYGKKVKGDATITIWPMYVSGVIQPIFQNPVRKVLPIDGSATVNFDIEKELKLTDEYERTVIVDVIVEEALTGRKQNNSVQVHLHKYEYKMELIKTADYYKPGLKYTAYVKVMNHDGTSIRADRNTITVRYGYSRVDEIYKENTYKLNKDGAAKLEFYPPRKYTNETALRIEAEYFDLKERIPPIPAAVSASNTYLQASVETDRPLVNLDVDVLINCTEPMKYITYELIGRGDVLIANTFQIDNRKEFRFHFVATHAMVPYSHLLVSYVRDDGELVADSVDVEIGGLLQNFVELQLNTVETRPESDVDITVRAQPNSYVGVLAVDHTVNSIRSGHDLSHVQVSKELQKYDAASASPYSLIMKDSKSHFFWKQGASNVHDIYHDSGALLLTNSVVSSFRPTLEDIYLRPVFYGSSTVKPDRGVGLSLPSATRPPLAGPYAFSRIPRPVWNKPKVFLNSQVHDTWLFFNFTLGVDGKTSIRRKIPSSLNTWSITGFSLDPIHGLGIVTSPKKIKVSKPFVVSFDLPHSVKRGEILAVPVVVSNHMNKDITVEVTLHNPEQKFEFAEISNEINSTRKVELYRKKKLSVKGNSGASVAFMITPLRLGSVQIKATGLSSSSGQDSAVKVLRVQPEGEMQYYTKTLLLDLRNSSDYKGNFTIELPKNLVAGSELIEASVIGDLLGPAIVNLENLVRLPTGCAEQNMVHFVPNLIVLKYLRNTRRFRPGIEKDAVVNLETSYQEQLSYKLSDGSFCIFGKSYEKGSVWLTAYSAASFLQAKPYIYIDNNIITTAFEWLAEKQASNGSFVETGPVIHSEIQNRNGNSLALTAFVTLAFIEYKNYNSSYTNTINKGLDYIARNIDENEEVYTLAICTYVLQLSKHPSRQNAFNLLDSKAKTVNGSKWWGMDFPASERNNPWNFLPKSMDIEATSYALLSFLEANLIEDSIPVLTWLLNQQNSLGGFASTHDTTVGLYALYKLVLKIGSGEADMRVEFKYKEQETNTFNINRENAMILQKLQVGNNARRFNVTASGKGLAMFRVSYQYSMNVTGPWPMFILDPQVDKNSDLYHLQLSICTSFVSRNLTDTSESNMAVMEVNLPSGFTADIDALPSLEVSQNVKKVETLNDYTTVLLYFDNLTTVEYCPTVSAYRTNKVAKQSPAYVSVYDYYDSSRHARIFYKQRKATVCDICEEEDCGNVCTLEPNPQTAGESKENKGELPKPFCQLIIALILLIVKIQR